MDCSTSWPPQSREPLVTHTPVSLHSVHWHGCRRMVHAALKPQAVRYCACIPDAPASASRVLGSQAHNTTPVCAVLNPGFSPVRPTLHPLSSSPSSTSNCDPSFPVSEPGALESEFWEFLQCQCPAKTAGIPKPSSCVPETPGTAQVPPSSLTLPACTCSFLPLFIDVSILVLFPVSPHTHTLIPRVYSLRPHCVR